MATHGLMLNPPKNGMYMGVHKNNLRWISWTCSLPRFSWKFPIVRSFCIT